MTVGAAGVVPTLATALRVPAPIVLLLAGIAVARVPGVPDLELDPFVVVFLFLPPIVYAASLRSSLRRLIHIAWWAVLPAAVLILAPLVAVAVAAHAVIEGLAWSSAFVLGGIAAATGAELLVATDAGVGIPRQLLTRIRAEAAVLPLVLLPLILIAIDAGVVGEIAWGRAIAMYIYEIVGGLVIGAGVGLLGVWTRRRTADGPPQIGISFAIPFLASLAGYAASASSIAAVIAAGFVIEAHYSGRAPGRSYSAKTQELGRAFWLQVTLLISGALIFIVGLSIPTALEGVDVTVAPMIAYVAGALALVTALRFVVAWARARRARDADRVAPAKEGLMLAWGGARTPLAFVVVLLVPETVANGALREAGRQRSLTIAHRGARDRAEARSAVFDAGRAALVRLYDDDEIGEETLLGLRQEIDAEAQRPAAGGSRDFAFEDVAPRR